MELDGVFGGGKCIVRLVMVGKVVGVVVIIMEFEYMKECVKFEGFKCKG